MTFNLFTHAHFHFFSVQIICAYKRCPGEDVCYSRDKECDGLNHCAYGNDETDCKGKSCFGDKKDFKNI